MANDLIIGTFLACGIFAVLHAHIRTYRIRQLFGVPWYCLLVGSDVGGSRSKITLRNYGLIGSPDALFFDPFHWSWVVCEYKSRKFSRYYSLKERYQIQLYLHMSRRFWCSNVKGRLGYRGGVLLVPYEQDIVTHLLRLRNEAIHASSQHVPADARPLHQRTTIPRTVYPTLGG